jgi:hypothetical protein
MVCKLILLALAPGPELVEGTHFDSAGPPHIAGGPSIVTLLANRSFFS